MTTRNGLNRSQSILLLVLLTFSVALNLANIFYFGPRSDRQRIERMEATCRESARKVVAKYCPGAESSQQEEEQ